MLKPIERTVPRRLEPVSHRAIIKIVVAQDLKSSADTIGANQLLLLAWIGIVINKPSSVALMTGLVSLRRTNMLEVSFSDLYS
jgi:hypothetical protein